MNLSPINMPRQANSETRSIHYEMKRKSNLPSTYSLHSRSEMNSKTPSQSLSPVRPNIVKPNRPQSRNTSRRSRPRKPMSTRPARNMNRIVSVSTLTLHRVPLSRAKTSSASLPNSSVHSRQSILTNVNMPTLRVLYKIPSPSGSRSGSNFATAVKTLRTSAWISQRIMSGSMPMPFLLSAFLMTRYVSYSLRSHGTNLIAISRDHGL